MRLRELFIESARQEAVASVRLTLEANTEANITNFQAGSSDSVQRQVNVASNAMVFKDMLKELVIGLE